MDRQLVLKNIWDNQIHKIGFTCKEPVIRADGML